MRTLAGDAADDAKETQAGGLNMNRWTSRCLTVYRRLARAYPHEFRMLYGDDLDRAGEDALPEAWSRYGVTGLARLMADIAWQLPLRYLVEIRQDIAYA